MNEDSDTWYFVHNQISFEKFDRKYLRFLAVKVLYLTVYEIWSLKENL